MAKTFLGKFTELAPALIHGKALANPHPEALSYAFDGAIEVGLSAANIGYVVKALGERKLGTAVLASGLATILGAAAYHHFDDIRHDSVPDFHALPADVKLAERAATVALTAAQILVNHNLGS